jgi:hypothetical protein
MTARKAPTPRRSAAMYRAARFWDSGLGWVMLKKLMKSVAM